MTQAYHFAAARDGEMYVSGLDCETFEEAEQGALEMVAKHFGLSCPPDEVAGDLDGFLVWCAASFEYH